ncbi:MAG: DUF1566 domain-containing protein, partial [Deltaproteobacteria bacterium]|nr:DUF1566 domain-containing protein [Deltaproteobacteria bacterium]
AAETARQNAPQAEDVTAKIRALEAKIATLQEKQKTDTAQGGQERFASLQTGDQSKKGSLLRSEPDKLRAFNLEYMIKKYNFFVNPENEKGDFPNQFVDNGNGTVTDRATGLMWQQEGSRSDLYYSQAEDFVSDLNNSKFAGYSDWRIPTLEELLSLTEPGRSETDLHLSPLLKYKRPLVWSADLSVAAGQFNAYFDIHYAVDFTTAKILTGKAKLTSSFGFSLNVFGVTAVRNVTE